MVNEFPQAVTIAGSDSDGSAGMQADLHTFAHSNVYGASIVTACVSGNSYGIHDSVKMPNSFIDQEFKDLADDYKMRAAKTGMLADADLMQNVIKNYKEYNFGPLVVDPVIVTKHGAMLLEEDAFQTLKDSLLPLAEVTTPNFYEGQKLTGMEIKNDDDMLKAAQEIQKLGAKNVMIKGRHDDKDQDHVKDIVLLESGKSFWLSGPYYDTKHKNGTGDSLSAGIAAELAKGTDVEDAIRKSHRFVNEAIKNSIGVAHAYGPINHLVKY